MQEAIPDIKKCNVSCKRQHNGGKSRCVRYHTRHFTCKVPLTLRAELRVRDHYFQFANKESEGREVKLLVCKHIANKYKT